MHCKTMWTVREWRRKGSLLVPVEVLRRPNIHTQAGLTAFASGFQGSYLAPTFLAIGAVYGKIQNNPLNVGATSVSLDNKVDLAGDSSLILGVGTSNQETVTFSARSGTGPYTYTISATTKSHAQNDIAVRLPLLTDSLQGLLGELEYDHANNPNQRMASLGGFSPGPSQWTMQFFFNAHQAVSLTFGLVGLCDSVTIGQGGLHNLLGLGYTHQSGYDAEIDVTVTMSN